MSRLSTASDVDEDGSLTMRRRAYSSPRNSTWGGDARKMSDQSGKKPPAAARAAAKARGRRSAVVRVIDVTNRLLSFKVWTPISAS